MAQAMDKTKLKRIFRICKDNGKKKGKSPCLELEMKDMLDLTVTTEDSKSMKSYVSAGKRSSRPYSNSGLSLGLSSNSSQSLLKSQSVNENERKISSDSNYLIVPSFLNDRKVGHSSSKTGIINTKCSSSSNVGSYNNSIPLDFENKELYLVKYDDKNEEKLFFTMDENFNEDLFLNFD